MSLAYFDTALGFASVMLMLSMLVTILVQMVCGTFNLRGKNLRWGVQRLIEKVIPDYAGHAKEIADKVLTHNALSHTLGRSGWPSARRNWRWCLRTSLSQRPPKATRLERH